MSNHKMRIAIEQYLATQLIRSALSHEGYSVSVNDGEETVLKKSRDEAEILKAMFSTDEDYLYVHDGEGKQLGWILLIYGNSGDDVISDYSTSLDFIVDPVMEIANLISDGGYRLELIADKEGAWNRERV